MMIFGWITEYQQVACSCILWLETFLFTLWETILSFWANEEKQSKHKET